MATEISAVKWQKKASDSKAAQIGTIIDTFQECNIYDFESPSKVFKDEDGNETVREARPGFLIEHPTDASLQIYVMLSQKLVGEYTLGKLTHEHMLTMPVWQYPHMTKNPATGKYDVPRCDDDGNQLYGYSVGKPSKLPVKVKEIAKDKLKQYQTQASGLFADLIGQQ